jgi:hypothetical protein
MMFMMMIKANKEIKKLEEIIVIKRRYKKWLKIESFLF